MPWLSQYKLALAGLSVAALMTLSAAGAWRWQANAYELLISEIRADQADALSEAQSQARAEEQRRQTAIEGIRRDAQDKISQARTDADIADAAADRLRARVEKLASTAASYSGVTPRGETASDPIILLADVFIELERAGREMAKAADARGIAGQACERAYDAL